jgi:hypothetical protein
MASEAGGGVSWDFLLAIVTTVVPASKSKDLTEDASSCSERPAGLAAEMAS